MVEAHVRVRQFQYGRAPNVHGSRILIEDWRNEYNTRQPHSSSRAIWSLFKSAICEAVTRAARCEAARAEHGAPPLARRQVTYRRALLCVAVKLVKG